MTDIRRRLERAVRRLVREVDGAISAEDKSMVLTRDYILPAQQQEISRVYNENSDVFSKEEARCVQEITTHTRSNLYDLAEMAEQLEELLTSTKKKT